MRIQGKLIAVSLLCLMGSSAQAQPAAGRHSASRDQCFRNSEYQSFKAIDDHAFYIRVNVNDYYRIDLAGTCPELTYPDAHLITVVRGSDMICGPLDWDLRIGQSGPGGFATPCIVSAQTRLTKAQADAIPPKLKP